ncbi:MAG: general secretion pathway protein GspB [Gammaproteobacteria bacterium]
MTSTDSIKSITVSPANSGVRSLAREARVPANSVPTTIPVSPTQTESPVPLKRTESLQTVFGVVGSPPNIAELVATGSDLPDLRLELHVFSPIPSERFVFINSNRYGEGDTLLEGSRVLTITIEGVILSHGGQNFLLPRN